MNKRDRRAGSELGWSSRFGRWAALAVLLGVAVLLGMRLVNQDGPALATLIFQTNPNSPQPTPTFTDTPPPTNTPLFTATPAPTNTPVATAGPGTPTLPPATDTPLPTDTPADQEQAAPTPTWTPPPPATDLQPPFQSPISPPTPTPVLGVAPPPVPPPLVPPSPTIEAGAPLTSSSEIVLLVRPLDGPSAAAEAGTARRLDAALFIDNLVIAAGYVWACFGVLALVAALVGGTLLLRRNQRSRQNPPPSVQPPPATPPSPAQPAPRAAPRPDRRGPTPPPPARFAARHNTADFDDLDRPDV